MIPISPSASQDLPGSPPQHSPPLPPMDRNLNFRRVFSLPETETLLYDVSAALEGAMIIHGRLYASQNFLCFYSNIFGIQTCEVYPFERIMDIQEQRKEGKVQSVAVITKPDKV
jgi:hypothetical protein